MNFLANPLVVGWIVLALVVVALAMYRKTLSNQEDDIIHVSGESTVTKQITLAHRLEKIDVWGKTLTIVLVLYGLGLAGWLIYQGWVSSVSLNN